MIANSAIEDSTMPVIAIPFPDFWVLTLTIPRIKLAIAKITPPAMVSLSQSESSNNAKKHKIPMIIDGSGSHKVPST